MFLKLFSSMLNSFIEDYDESENYEQRFNNSLHSSMPQKYDEGIIKLYPHASGLIYVDDKTGKDPYALTYEVLKSLKLNPSIDYEFSNHALLFKTKEMKKSYDDLSTIMADYARAAISFRDLDKKEMGSLSFIDENTFYIKVQPNYSKEKELLKEVTIFYKNHGYNVYEKFFQKNFFRYKDYALNFYVRDEMMAAELSFYISGKDLGIIL